MPRKNRDEKRTPQAPRGAKRPRGLHRKQISPGTKQAVEWLERHRGDEKAA